MMTPAKLAVFLFSSCALASCAAHHSGGSAATTMQAVPPAAAPDAPMARDEFLDHLVGDWAMTRSMRGKTFHCDADVRWVLGDRWICLHLRPPAEPPQPGRLPYEAFVYIGFDATAKEYIAYWHDTFGAQYGAAGRGKRAGDTVEFCFDDGDGSRTWNTYTYDRAANTWTSLIENQGKGQERTVFAQETYRRH